MKYNLKFKVTNVLHSMKIQQLLFKIGFSWTPMKNLMCVEFQHTDSPFLYADAYDSSITYSDEDPQSFFEGHSHPEVVLLHPKQLIFLKNLQPVGNIVLTIIENGFYFKHDTKFLNALLTVNRL